MKSFFISAFALLVVSSVSCKGRDKCATCPTFSEVEKIDQKQIQY